MGDDELLLLANLLDTAGSDGRPPVDSVTDGALDADAAKKPEEVQTAGLGKVLLGLLTTSSGRAILRALNRMRRWVPREIAG